MTTFRKSIASLVLFLALPPAQVAAATFPDVAENTVNYNAIEYLKTKGVISGYPDGSFQPDKTINRAEALKMVLLASKSPAASNQILAFPDVKSSDWFYEYVRQGVEANIVDGYPDGSFKPGNNINVAESLKIILLAFKSEVGNPPSTKPYPDVETTAWYSPYADYGKLKQLIWPFDDGNLHAERDITRGEFAQIIYRLMYMKENNYSVFPLTTDWQTFTHPSEGYLTKYPFGWKKLTVDDQVIFWKQDEANAQLSWARVFPNSATVVIAVDPNSENVSLDTYLTRLQYESGASLQKMTLNDYPFASITVQNAGTVDYFVELPNKTILVAYTQVGDGANRFYLTEEIRNLIGSIRAHEGPGPAHEGPGPSNVLDTDKESFLSQVRQNILVTGKGKTTLDLFSDELITETDSIGIGTGPIDYYYSAQYDVTLKLDRNADTILAMSDGNTTAF